MYFLRYQPKLLEFYGGNGKCGRWATRDDGREKINVEAPSWSSRKQPLGEPSCFTLVAMAAEGSRPIKRAPSPPLEEPPLEILHPPLLFPLFTSVGGLSFYEVDTKQLITKSTKYGGIRRSCSIKTPIIFNNDVKNLRYHQRKSCQKRVLNELFAS